MANQPEILYENRLTGGTASPSAAAVCLIPNTFERYNAANGSFILQASSSFTATGVGVAVHNLGDTGKTITIGVSSTTTGTFTTVYTGSSLTTNAAILATFSSRTVRRVQITVSGGSGNFSIGVVYAGVVLLMPRPVYVSGQPITLSGVTEFQSTMSDSGNFLSRSIIRRGVSGSITFKYLSDTFYRASFHPFVKAARTTPFFLKWRPDDYPQETVFCHTMSDIVPSNSGPSKLMQVAINVRGYGDLQ